MVVSLANDRSRFSLFSSTTVNSTVDECRFTLLELMVVLCIAFIAATMVIPTATTAIRGVRLSSSGASYADLLQQARVRAVRDDRYYTVITNAGSTGNPPYA